MRVKRLISLHEVQQKYINSEKENTAMDTAQLILQL